MLVKLINSPIFIATLVVGLGVRLFSSTARWEISARQWKDVQNALNIVFSDVLSMLLAAAMEFTTVYKQHNWHAVPGSKAMLTLLKMLSLLQIKSRKPQVQKPVTSHQSQWELSCLDNYQIICIFILNYLFIFYNSFLFLYIILDFSLRNNIFRILLIIQSLIKMDKVRKYSDFTCNSPNGKLPKQFLQFMNPHVRHQNGETNKSGRTNKSKYSNSSKLTQSQLYNAISKTNEKQRAQGIIKQRDVQIEILKNSLEGIKINQANLLSQMGEMFRKYSDLAQKIECELQISQDNL